MTCAEVATAAGLQPGRKSGQELLFTCPRHDDRHPSLSINDTKDTWLCGPCGVGGTAWQLSAFIANLEPGDKESVKRWLTEHGLFNGNGNNSRIVATYGYVDENGTHFYDVVRFEPKDFRQRRADGIWKMDGVRLVLYRLPDVLKAEYVFIVEGEKAADALRDIGLTATCSPGGAGKWRDEYSASFKPHQHVTILPDNDKPGRDHAQQVAISLHGKVASLKVIELPGLPEKGDPYDWTQDKDRDDAAEELSILSEKAPEWTSATSVPNGTEVNAEPESFIDFAPAFLSTVDPPLEYIIPELTPRGALKLSHGDPRTMKSLAGLEEAVAAATGTPAFGMKRFTPGRSYRVLYCSQEDAAPIVRPRVRKLLSARGIGAFPQTLAFSVYKGIDLDSPEWRERFFEEVTARTFELVTIDPARGFTAFADAGPKDVVPIAKFLRRFTSRGITVHVIHHDTKPPANGPDTRRRSHRASGGAWFSVSECPVSFEKIGDRQSLVSPEDYKFSADPAPFTIEYREDDSGIRLIGESTSANDAVALALDEAVLTHLAEHPGATGNSIIKSIRKNRDGVLASLERLFKADKVDYAEGPRKSKLWTLRTGLKTSRDH